MPNSVNYTNTVTQSGAGSAWSGLTNVQGSGTGETTGDRATGSAVDFDYSQYIEFKNFGFSIPTDATIDGIEAKTRLYCSNQSGANGTYSNAQLLIAGTRSGTNLRTGGNVPTSITTVTTGGPTNKWGLTPTPANVNHTDFGYTLRFLEDEGTGKTSTFYVYWTTITVYYTESGGGGGSQTHTMFFGA